MKKYFGFIENKRAYFYFDQVQLKNGSFGIMFTNNPDSEKALLTPALPAVLFFLTNIKPLVGILKKPIL